MRHSYETSQWVPFPAADVFLFFCDPDNLPKLMPQWQQARIERSFLAAPPLSPLHWSGKMRVAGKGSLMTITFRPVPFSPVRLRWVALISEFEWNHHFCDEQKMGPLAYWKHCHLIAPEQRDGVDGSLVTDKVTYGLPLGLLGGLANAIAIKHQMKATFEFRQKMLLQLLSKGNEDHGKVHSLEAQSGLS